MTKLSSNQRTRVKTEVRGGAKKAPVGRSFKITRKTVTRVVKQPSPALLRRAVSEAVRKLVAKPKQRRRRGERIIRRKVVSYLEVRQYLEEHAVGLKISGMQLPGETTLKKLINAIPNRTRTSVTPLVAIVRPH